MKTAARLLSIAFAAAIITASLPVAQAATLPSSGAAGQEDVAAIEMYTDMAAIKVETKQVGNTTYYAFKIKNIGDFTAKNVTVTKQTIWRYKWTNDYYSQKNVSFHWDAIAPGQEIPITIACEPLSAGTYCADGSIYVTTTFAEKNHDNNYAEYKSSYP